MKNIFFILLLLAPFISRAQDEVFEVVKTMPEYPGGTSALLTFINKNFVYPENAEKNNKQGTIYVRFIVEPDSSVSDVKAIKSFDDECAEEAVRIIKLTKWVCGKQRGKPVRVVMRIPVKFEIDDSQPEKESEPEIFEIVEKMPVHVGGQDSLKAIINRNLIYPPTAIENGKQGTVYVQFIVEMDGSVSNVKAIKTFDESCAKEAIRIVQLTHWEAGEMRGKKVRTMMRLPIRFKLD